MKDEMFFEALGIDISNLITTKEVLVNSGLDYKVVSENIYLHDLIQIQDKFANVRRDTNKILGIVGKNYNIVQNEDGFEFIDKLIDLDFKFVSAGSYNDGAGAFIVLKRNPITIKNEEFNIMLLITNCFDGSGTIKIEFTPIRTICKSTLIIIDKSIDTKISIKHCSQSRDGMSEINKIIDSYERYEKYFRKLLNTLIETKITGIEDIIKDIVPIDEKSSNIIIARTKAIQDDLIKIYNNCSITGDNVYRMLLSVANYESHRLPLRDTGNSQIYLDRVMSGMPFTNDAFKYLKRRFL